MEKIVLIGLIGAIVGRVSGVTYPCGRNEKWVPYKDKSCLLVLNTDDYGLQSKEEAEILCSTIDRYRGTDEEAPGLLTIKTPDKQKYLVDFLFDYDVNNPVWLGLTMGEQDNVLRWSDGTGLYFSNLPSNSSSDINKRCVEFVSKSQGGLTAGQWIGVDCNLKNAVVCEKTQRWTTPKLLNALLNLRLELSRQDTQMRHDIDEMKRELQGGLGPKTGSVEQDVATMKANPVPVGFIYFQLPYSPEPKEIWPQVQWRDVSDWYAGVFFRVVGGDAEDFGNEQEASSPLLERVETVDKADNKFLGSNIPASGGWSGPVSLGWRQEGSSWRGMKFRLSTDEVRPVNMAVRVWQRQT